MTYLINYMFQTKIEDLNIHVFNIIAGINKSKILTKHVSCECKCKFDGWKCNSDQKWNNNKCWFECQKYHIYEKDYIKIIKIKRLQMNYLKNKFLYKV